VRPGGDDLAEKNVLTGALYAAGQHARADSISAAYLRRAVRVSSRADSLHHFDMVGRYAASRYHLHGDTVGAARLYAEALPYAVALPDSARADHLRRYAETLTDAAIATDSLRLYALALVACQGAERAAVALGDSGTHHRLAAARAHLFAAVDALPQAQRVAVARMADGIARPVVRSGLCRACMLSAVLVLLLWIMASAWRRR
jgi:hypothetical protein